MMRTLVDPRQFPELSAVIESGGPLEVGDSYIGGFEFGLGRVLDGIAVYVEEKAATQGAG